MCKEILFSLWKHIQTFTGITWSLSKNESKI